MAPYITPELKNGEFALSVLAISCGKCDPHKDHIALVFVDEAGRMREHTEIDNLYDAFTVATLKLMNRVKELFRGCLSLI